MLSYVRPAVVMMVLFTLLTGLAYPLAMTGIAGVAFPAQAGGSLVSDARGKVIGSSLLAQGFARPEYLHPRPSAAGAGYDPTSSGGSNLGPMDPKLASRMTTDAATYRKDNPTATVVPADALTTSGSGLDPDISPANAQLQAARIAARRGASVSEVLAVIDANTAQPTLGFLGDPRVNVLAVNRALDARYPVAQPKA
ncbi:MAG TPA: potassium-transporting ATPase subunit KdpC [Caulobacteraceae bacterium]|jgi:K+-transporting ATPase ATPase C chain|nr:potassium-transporting ATPase subunit KdpC [Caulobacteraceae bacterium]